MGEGALPLQLKLVARLKTGWGAAARRRAAAPCIAPRLPVLRAVPRGWGAADGGASEVRLPGEAVGLEAVAARVRAGRGRLDYADAPRRRADRINYRAIGRGGAAIALGSSFFWTDGGFARRALRSRTFGLRGAVRVASITAHLVGAHGQLPWTVLFFRRRFAPAQLAQLAHQNFIMENKNVF